MNTRQPKTVAVLGAGAWGTALAVLLARNGIQVRLWGHEPAHMQTLQRQRSNRAFLRGIAFPDDLDPTDHLDTAVKGADMVLLAVPSHALREVLHHLQAVTTSHMPIAWATKGLEQGSHKLMSVVACEELGAHRPYAVLSGPTFAGEVAAGLPAAVTIAATDESFAQALTDLCHNDSFRAYTSDDLVGVQLGGAVKNVLAIAAGIADGLGFGANTRAALITRGLAEIMRLGEALGGRRETFMGLAGLGDLVLTCTDDQSRNRRFGLAIARGASSEQARQSIGQVVEGLQTTREVAALAAELDVEMPICAQVHAVLFGDVAPHEAVHQLFARRLKAEF